MIKNVALKKILKSSIFPFVSFVNKLLPKDDKVVLLYSANKGIVFCNKNIRDYLLSHGFEKRYSIYCGVEKMEYAEDIPNVTFVSGIKAIFVFFRAGHVFYTAGQLPIKPSKNQCVIHMQHGNADFKSMGANTNINNGDEFFFTYMISPSNLYVPHYAKAYKCSEANIAVLGDPMCDELLSYPKQSYNFDKYFKTLVWLPTFRQSEDMGYDDSHLETLIPLFADEDYCELNEELSKHNIYLVVKLHPAQKTSDSVKRHFSHLSVFSHSEFLNSEYEMYKLVASSDGLIGDYSSASMQYLHMDRPMAFVVPDLEDYKSTRGFVFDNPEDYMGGHIIRTKDEFFAFLKDFASGKDVYKEKRHWVYDQVYKYHDGNSCERIISLSGIK